MYWPQLYTLMLPPAAETDTGMEKLVTETWNRMKMGGEIASQQRIYFVNMLEMRDQKYGTQQECAQSFHPSTSFRFLLPRKAIRR